MKKVSFNNLEKFEYLPYAKINLGAIKNNAKIIKNSTKALVCAVVKSNAYGHGLVESALAINEHCDCFAVCSLCEGVSLRIAGINKPIICLLPINNVRRALLYDITLCIHSIKYFKELNRFASKNGLKVNCHIAVNTGMNRLGIDNLNELDSCLKSNGNINITGIYSHFYNVESKKECETQFLSFLPFVQMAKLYNKEVIAHISASGGFVLNEKYHLDMVRIGIMNYGYCPIKSDIKLQRAMTVIAPLIQKRRVQAGENLLYGDYKTNTDLNLGIYAYGYANGVRYPLFSQINNSCMNICANLQQEKELIIMDNATKVAKKLKTIEYHVLTTFGNNCKRIYGDLNENYFGKIQGKKTCIF